MYITGMYITGRRKNFKRKDTTIKNRLTNSNIKEPSPIITIGMANRNIVQTV